MTFTLSISLGNAAMSSGPDLAEALRVLADKVEGLEGLAAACAYDASGRVRDANGNTVGKWRMTDGR